MKGRGVNTQPTSLQEGWPIRDSRVRSQERNGNVPSREMITAPASSGEQNSAYESLQCWRGRKLPRHIFCLIFLFGLRRRTIDL